MNHTRRSIALFAALAMGFSCANPSLGGDKDLDAKDPAKGCVSISLPGLSGAYLALAARSGAASRGTGPQSRAYVVADAARIDFFRSGESVAFNSLDVPASSNAAGAETPASVRYKVYLPIGTGYKAKVTLFNNANDLSSRATVTGTSASFDIASLATTPVAVTCLPVNPTALVPGQEASVSVAPFSGEPFSGKVTPGGERWFSFQAASGMTRVFARPAAGGKAVPALFVYDSSGMVVASFSETGSFSRAITPGTACAGYVPTTKDATYYLAAIDAGDALAEMSSGDFSGGDHTFFLSVATPEPDSFESDDLPSAAKEIAPESTQHRSIYPLADLDCVKFDAMEAKGYDISLLSADGTCPDIVWTLLDATNTEVTVTKDSDPYSGILSSCTQWIPRKSGVYTLTISASSGGLGLYDLKIVENKAPQNLDAVQDPADPCRTLDVSWSPVAHATGYRLYQVLENGGSGEIGGEGKGLSRGEILSSSESLKLLYEGPWKADPYRHAGLEASSSYTYRVSAIINGAETPLSAPVTKRTKQETILYVYIN